MGLHAVVFLPYLHGVLPPLVQEGSELLQEVALLWAHWPRLGTVVVVRPAGLRIQVAQFNLPYPCHPCRLIAASGPSDPDPSDPSGPSPGPAQVVEVSCQRVVFCLQVEHCPVRTV